MMDWYKRMGFSQETAIAMMGEEIAAELESNGKVVSFTAYLRAGMTATQYQKLDLAKSV